MKRDIDNRDDLVLLMDTFYSRLLNDTSISYFFTDVAGIDLKKHLHVLVDFWEMVLFGKDSYRKNVMEIHMNLHRASPMQEHHFEIWLRHFSQTLEDLFEGERATMALQRAKSIATMMRIKISQLQN
jgi:hemoglobin